MMFMRGRGSIWRGGLIVLVRLGGKGGIGGGFWGGGSEFFPFFLFFYVWFLVLFCFWVDFEVLVLGLDLFEGMGVIDFYSE